MALYSLYFLQLNANKKSITLNMRDPEGKKILAELLKKADVFVENIGPGDVESLVSDGMTYMRSIRV